MTVTAEGVYVWQSYEEYTGLYEATEIIENAPPAYTVEDGWAQMHEADGLKLKENNKRKQWAQPEVAEALQEVAAEWNQLHPEQPMTVGDISKKGGGELAPHISHQKGVDMDVKLMQIDLDGLRGKVGSANYSQDLTRELIRTFIEKSPLEIEAIFFADPDIASEFREVKLKEDHMRHFHVRFKDPRK